jgi:uncharacterized coiled-coil protein SlyX
MMLRKLLALAGIVILLAIPYGDASAVFAQSGSLTLDWTVNVSVIVTIAAATGSFIILSLKTQWRVEAVSKRVGHHDEVLDRISSTLANVDKQVSLGQQQMASFTDVIKQHGDTLNIVARQDERLLATNSELKELRDRVRELEKAS